MERIKSQREGRRSSDVSSQRRLDSRSRPGGRAAQGRFGEGRRSGDGRGAGIP